MSLSVRLLRNDFINGGRSHNKSRRDMELLVVGVTAVVEVAVVVVVAAAAAAAFLLEGGPSSPTSRAPKVDVKLSRLTGTLGSPASCNSISPPSMIATLLKVGPSKKCPPGKTLA
jgi:hypothetical protein